MSHPLSDPAVSSVAALMGGLEVCHPARARILEIGCSSGLNLIALASRWPECRCVGVDLSLEAIIQAKELAAAAGVKNVHFQAVDLRDFHPDGERYDFIIAHGFFSWVPDDVKARLFAFCHGNLTPNGIATISFNLECGWRPRFPVIEKVRAIQQAGAGDEMSALAILRSVTEQESRELEIIDDMMAKGPAILPFDDFGPVNDPWPLDRFVHAAARSGLRWLGESDPGENFPPGLDGEVLENIRVNAADPLSFQMAADAAAGRTFRSGVLCRDDARLVERIPFKRWLGISIRTDPSAGGLLNQRIFETIDSFRFKSIPISQVINDLSEYFSKDLIREIIEGIQRGWILPRVESVRFATDTGDFPHLSPLRLECARRGLPLVDIWHRPCSFPVAHYEILAAMDGSRSRTELVALAGMRCPELAFESWIRHLAERGMFS